MSAKPAKSIRALLPEVAVSLSSDVVAELWEYQRLVTTCANAFVQPLMDRYVRRLERELWQRGFRGALRLMHSAGGLVSPETARAFPIRLLGIRPGGRRSGDRVLRASWPARRMSSASTWAAPPPKPA